MGKQVQIDRPRRGQERAEVITGGQNDRGGQGQKRQAGGWGLETGRSRSRPDRSQTAGWVRGQDSGTRQRLANVTTGQ